MIFNKHLELEGQHAIFGASKYSWLNDKNEIEIIDRFIAGYMPQIGTSIHEFAKNAIVNRIKLSKNDKKMILMHLVTNDDIPRAVIDELDLELIFETVRMYVNDSIGFRMEPEVILRYSGYSFGTSDSVSFRDNFLRIHDLKTGSRPAKIEQLLVYAAYLCLEYSIDPFDISGSELRIYQKGEALIHNPDPKEIKEIMLNAINHNKVIDNFLKLGG